MKRCTFAIKHRALQQFVRLSGEGQAQVFTHVICRRRMSVTVCSSWLLLSQGCHFISIYLIFLFRRDVEVLPSRSTDTIAGHASRMGFVSRLTVGTPHRVNLALLLYQNATFTGNLCRFRRVVGRFVPQSVSDRAALEAVTAEL